ncbi:Uncharacterised protein [Mycobacteroides abscessus subsp. abscessus]|nr:Uncharacterised protein [Mycobacteroides abscessus subsp. abscessus]
MEREVTADDGHARRSREGAGCLRACDDGKLFQKLVVAGEALVVADVSFSEGNCVASVCVDSDIVAAHQDGNHGKGLKAIDASNIVDGLPCLSHRLIDDSVETVVDLHDEPLETIVTNRAWVVSAFIRRVFERIKARVDCVEGSAEVAHDRTHAVAVDVDHADGGQLRERIRGPDLVRHILKGPLQLKWVLVQVLDSISDYLVAQSRILARDDFLDLQSACRTRPRALDSRRKRQGPILVLSRLSWELTPVVRKHRNLE